MRGCSDCSIVRIVRLFGLFDCSDCSDCSGFEGERVVKDRRVEGERCREGGCLRLREGIEEWRVGSFDGIVLFVRGRIDCLQ